MKKILFILAFVTTNLIFSQEYFEKKGIAFAGYDVTEYQNNHALKGDKKFATTYNKSTFYFASEENKTKFLSEPEKYIPAYNGYCAYAVGEKSKKVSVDPETFELKDGKVYLFYNSWGTNTLDMWNNNNPEELRKKADLNWEKIK